MKLNTYKIIYKDGKEVIVKAKKAIDVIKQYDLSNKENIETRIIQL